MAMMEDEGGVSSATIVTAGDDGGHGNRRPNRHRWQLKVVLPSSALPPSHYDSGLRGVQKPVARRVNVLANAVAPARCTSGRRHDILQEEDEGGGGDNNSNNTENTDGTDDTNIGNLPPPGGI